MKQALSALSVLLLFSIPTTHAATLYVSSTGTGASCTKADPCGSIQGAVNNAIANDEIMVGAGQYTENVRIVPGKDGISITGKGAGVTVVTSAGGVPNLYAPPTVPLDAVFDVIATGVKFKGMTVGHGAGIATKRDIAFFVRRPADDVQILKCDVSRSRDPDENDNLEPTAPGSRGVFVIEASGAIIKDNKFRGNYEDSIHIPAPDSVITKNDILNAPRIGIAIIQEGTGTDSTGNIIMKNLVVGSGLDGIQMQGDAGMISKNTVTGSGRAGIKLCGADVGDCAPPGNDEDADNNNISKNILSGNAGGDIVDDGNGNTIN